MESILEVLNQPIVLTMVTITFGSFLLSLVAERRARRNKRRDQAISFLNEAGDNINTIFPAIYKHLRTGKIEVDEEINTALSFIFSKRMSVQVGSQAYLRSETFYKAYFQLLDEIAIVINSMSAYDADEAAEHTISQLRANRIRLSEKWPIEEERLNLDPIDVIEEYIAWMDMIMLRTTATLTSHLKAEIR